jgi:hypothetical protein
MLIGRPWTARDVNYYIPDSPYESPNPYFPSQVLPVTTWDKLSIVNRLSTSGAGTNSVKRIQFFYNLDAIIRLNDASAERIYLVDATNQVCDSTHT